MGAGVRWDDQEQNWGGIWLPRFLHHLLWAVRVGLAAECYCQSSQNPRLIFTWEKLCPKDWRWTLSLLGRVLEAVSNRLAGFHYQGTGIPGFLQTFKSKTVNLQESLRLDTRKHGLDGIDGGGRVVVVVVVDGWVVFRVDFATFPCLHPWPLTAHFNAEIRGLLKKGDSEHVKSLAPHWEASCIWQGLAWLLLLPQLPGDLPYESL